MNYKRKKNKNRKARREMLLGKWGKGASRANKFFYQERKKKIDASVA